MNNHLEHSKIEPESAYVGIATEYDIEEVEICWLNVVRDKSLLAIELVTVLPLGLVSSFSEKLTVAASDNVEPLIVKASDHVADGL